MIKATINFLPFDLYIRKMCRTQLLGKDDNSTCAIPYHHNLIAKLTIVSKT